VSAEAAAALAEHGDAMLNGNGAVHNGLEQLGDDAAVKTLDGATAEDEFASDAVNYQILLGKIDVMLERLQLDA
jgi:hypothetical protein